MSNWFDVTHPEYDLMQHKWRYAQDHYSGDAIFDNIDDYLQRRQQGESDDAYTERKNIADYTPLFGHVVDSLAGMLFAVEEKAQRDWFSADEDGEPEGDSLGDPEEPGTPAFALWNKADGEKMNWDTLWKQFSTDIITNQFMWVLVDGKTEARPNAAVKTINPLDVHDWVTDSEGRLVEVKVRDTDYERSGVTELAEEEDVAIVYTLDGWVKYKKVVKQSEGGKDPEISIVEIARGAYYYEDRDGRQVLPINRFELPLRRYVGYILAKKNNAIFNKESAKDFLEWVACFPKLNLFADDDLFNEIIKKLGEGSNVLQNKPDASNAHDYIAPSTAPAERLEESLQQKLEHFLYVAFQQYADSAREKTATEVRQDLAKGIGAFLELLKGTIDEAENFAFWILEQVYFPAKKASVGEDGEINTEQIQPSQSREIWGQASVERSNDFMPIDMEERIREMSERFFGMGTVPANTEALVEVAKKILSFYDISADEDEIKAIIEARQMRNSQSSDLQSELERIRDNA